ncbi:DUF559 domain-containing protein [Priestia aryabhattai]|uniref:DUF559 domain-containing protein n=1 Tax=Priestia aryabhattai TaxID=412384 RepID=UPI001C8E070B|nr:DUF559 domain-containing protein [Priestia aryabhattai]MBY0078521.1 DUF559 domain-containing protein [Priestia aryabhattai]
MENYNDFQEWNKKDFQINDLVFNKEIEKTKYAPKVSETHKSVYEELFILVRGLVGEERFDGPWMEHRVSRSSLDIGFIKGFLNPIKGLTKIAYEIDGPDHDEEYDKRRDWYLLNKQGWYIFRIKVETIDELGAKKVAQEIYDHLLYHLGFVKQKRWLPKVISTYQDGGKRRIH